MPQITVIEHLLFHQKESPMATGRFTRLLNDLILAAKIISREVRKAGLVDALGFTGEINVQGEEVQKLDEFANKVLIHRMLKRAFRPIMQQYRNLCGPIWSLCRIISFVWASLFFLRFRGIFFI